jgi:hypothetical protein
MSLPDYIWRRGERELETWEIILALLTLAVFAFVVALR